MTDLGITDRKDVISAGFHQVGLTPTGGAWYCCEWRPKHDRTIHRRDFSGGYLCGWVSSSPRHSGRQFCALARSADLRRAGVLFANTGTRLGA
jgi:hypothetical protein